MARKVNKRREKRVIDEAAKKAAEEALDEITDSDDTEDFDSPEERDQFLADQHASSLSDQEAEQRDAYAYADEMVSKRGGFYRARHYVNNAWHGSVDGPYSWEQFVTDNPDVHGVVKTTIVDSNNKFVTSQTMRIARKAESKNRPEVESHQPRDAGSLEMLEVMKENQREAETKAQAQQAGLASIMSAVVQSQSQNAQMMMTMMQEANKQTQNLILAMMQRDQAPKGPDPIMTLLTTLLTQKPKEDGIKPLELVKLVEDAKKTAKEEERRNYEFLEKKSEALAELKAQAMGGDEEGGDESFTKTLVKGFLPVLSQMAANQQGRPAGVQQAEIEAQQFVEPQPVQAIPAARPQPQRRPQPLNQPQQAATSRPAPQNVPGQGAVAQNRPQLVQLPKDPAQLSRLKGQLFEFCASDIGQAMLDGGLASKTAETCLKKLEIEGVPRQTVANLFELKDFYGYADQYGLPPEAKLWLKEFHEAIQALNQPVAANPSTPPASTTGGNGHGTAVAGKSAPPVDVIPANKQTPSSPVQPTTKPGVRVVSPRTRSKEPAKNL